jgi:hypothetical protein
MLEATGQKLKVFFEEVGVETDEDHRVNPDEDRTVKRRRTKK